MSGFYAILEIPIVEQSVIDEPSIQSSGVEYEGSVNEHCWSKIIKINNTRDVCLIMVGCFRYIIIWIECFYIIKDVKNRKLKR